MLLREISLDGRPAGVAALAEALAAVLDGGPAVLPLDGRSPSVATLREAMAPDEPVEPNTAVIIATSGSTGEPKGVLLSADAQVASARATHDRLGGPGRWLLATPAQYVGGLQVLTRALLAGTRPAAVDLSVPFRSGSFLAAAREVLTGAGPGASGPYYTAMVPTQLARLLDGGDVDGREALTALRAFDAIILGAAATPPRLRERAEAAGVRVVTAYGMSETASGCVYDGRPLDGLRVRLADGAGADRDGVGTVELSGPMLAHGYRRRPELTATAFAGGWFRTGDAGRLADGTLEILGRTDDMVNTGGVKVPPTLVERALATLPEVREACVVGVPDERWGQAVVAAVVPADPSTLPREDALRAVVRARAGRAAAPKRFLFVAELPLRGPGKIDRVAVRELFTRPFADR